MVKLSEKLQILVRMVSDRRLRMDVKALSCATDLYVSYGWDLCKDLGIDKLLGDGATVEGIMKERKIRFKAFLEHVLDLLAGKGYLRLDGDRYFLVKEPPEVDPDKYGFLEKSYPNSVAWNYILLKRAPSVIRSGRKRFDASFDHHLFLELWDGIMRESPWSFRKIAIKRFTSKLKGGEEILDLGCGSGVSIEQMLSVTNKVVKITGMDSSAVSLKKAGSKMKELAKVSKDPVYRQNALSLKFMEKDLRKGIPKGKEYDVVFLSLLLNHIPEEEFERFFSSVRSILKVGGTMVVYQIIHQSKLKRAAMWPMHVVPTHKDYPYRESYRKVLDKVFKKVDEHLDGVVMVAKK